jgi:hypothetical protein
MQSDMQELRKLLAQFQQTMGDLQRIVQASEQAASDHAELWTGQSNSASTAAPAVGTGMSASVWSVGRNGTLNDPEQARAMLRRLLDAPMLLDVAISQRQFEPAVLGVLEPTIKSLQEPGLPSSLVSSLRHEMDLRKRRLSLMLLEELRRPALSPSDSRWSARLLVRLGQGEVARDAFLQIRAARLEKDLR